jgi:rRNA maturation protein Nop10
MGLSSPESSSASSRLVDAVAADVADAFARFVADHGDDTIVALALCSVDDAAPPYIMGATLDDIGPIKGTQDTFNAHPADWSWNDEGHEYRYTSIIGEMLKHQPESFEKHGLDIFEGIVEGLKKFDAGGSFQGKLPREQMLLILWIEDPSGHNSRGVMKWVEQTNPKPVAKWFNANYSYRSY